MEFLENNPNQPRESRAAVSREQIINEYYTRIQTITSEIGFDQNEYVRLYLTQLQSYVCVKSRSKTGGVFPITIDSETSEGYCLLGLANIGRRDCDEGDDDYFYKLPDKSIGGVRNVLCHFHGWVDYCESHPQAKAREGYEESRGLFGSMLDIWRCLSLEGYSYQMPCLPPLSLINLGKTNTTERATIVARFLQCPVYSAAMAETRGVRFIPLKQLYEALKYTYHFQIPTSLSMLDSTAFPHDSVWVRPFLDEWLTEEEDEEYPLRDIPVQWEEVENVDFSTLPTHIHSPWHDAVITLVVSYEKPNPKPKRLRCRYCYQPIDGNTTIPYYSCNKSQYLEEKMTWYHASCLFHYDSLTHTWTMKDTQVLCNEHYRFQFFEDPMIQRIMKGDGDGSDCPILPISSLPRLDRKVITCLQTMLCISEDLQREYQVGHPHTTREDTHRLITCITCGDQVYIDKRARYRTCRVCKNLSDKRNEVAGGGGRSSGGGRGHSDGRGRGGRGASRGGR